ncbi:MAG TPA: hypothetical protein VGC54_12875 [Planctomycetota bacterium]
MNLLRNFASAYRSGLRLALHGALFAAAAPAFAQDPAPQEPAPDLQEIARRLDLLAGEVAAATTGDADAPGGVSIGGYGEMLYEHFPATRDDGAPLGRNDTIDLLRAVLYFGYEFDADWHFNSEIEFEHATTGRAGEVAVEFAWLEYQALEELAFRAGLLLVPMGFLNEQHEPTTFYSARRPGTETAILPTTWRENGVMAVGELFDRLEFRAAVFTGFDAAGFSAAGLRGGRQKGSKAKAEDLAGVLRLDAEVIPGLRVGGSAWMGGSGQDLMRASGTGIGAATDLYEAHAEWRWRGLRARALGVRGSVGDVLALNRALGLGGGASIGEELEGGYLELGYDVLTLCAMQTDAALIPFARWEVYDTQAEVPAGFVRDGARDLRILTAGVAWQPAGQIVVKADWQSLENRAGTGFDQYALAVGYVF